LQTMPRVGGWMYKRGEKEGHTHRWRRKEGRRIGWIEREW